MEAAFVQGGLYTGVRKGTEAVEKVSGFGGAVFAGFIFGRWSSRPASPFHRLGGLGLGPVEVFD